MIFKHFLVVHYRFFSIKYTKRKIQIIDGGVPPWENETIAARIKIFTFEFISQSGSKLH